MLRPLLALVAVLAVAVPAATLAPPLQPEVGPDEVPNEVVVSFDGPIPADAEAWVAALGGQVLLRNDAIHFLSVRLADAAAAEAFLARAEARPDVAHAALDGIMRIHLTPNDPLFTSQYAPQQAQLPLAWDITLGSHSVKVAILDTGTTPTHPDLAANMCGPFLSFVSGEPTIIDGNGHGTHTSGSASARIDNAVGIAGASNSCIMAGKVCNAGGSCPISAIASGITWAADNGADVISMSFGGPGADPTTQAAVRYAYTQKGVLLVASAGNSGCNSPLPTANKMGYPAEFDEVVGVGALDAGGVVAGYSQCSLDLELVAGGSSVLSTVPGGYASYTGTSMSAPLVAGAAALVKAAIPTIAAADLRCLLDLTASDVLGYPPGRDPETGWGIVNPTGAINIHNLLVQQGLWDEFQQACVTGARAIMH